MAKMQSLKLFAVFSTIVWNFIFIVYCFVYWNALHLTAKRNVILLKNDFLAWLPTDFLALKMFQLKCYSVFNNWLPHCRWWHFDQWCDEAGKYSYSSNVNGKFTIRRITNTNANSYLASMKLYYTCIWTKRNIRCSCSVFSQQKLVFDAKFS